MGGITDTATRQPEIQSLFEAEQNGPPRLLDRSNVPGTPDVLTVDCEDWHGALMRSLELNIAATPTLLHQDTHLANWYALPDGSMRLADWQCVARGQWAFDVAYALAIGLITEDRRASERDLIGVYLQRLADAVQATPSFQEAWLAYRQQMVHAVAFWLAPFGIGEGGPVAADVSLVNIQRADQAIDDLDSFDAPDAGLAAG